MVNSVNNVGYKGMNSVGINPNFNSQNVQYTTNPYPNDAFTYSNNYNTAPKKSNGIVGKLLLAAVTVIGGCTAARKFLPAMKNYTKVLENATLKEKSMNLIASIGDKTIEYSTKAINKTKKLVTKTGTDEVAEAAKKAPDEKVVQSLNTAGHTPTENPAQTLSEAAKNGKQIATPTTKQANKTTSKTKKE